jgi:hypothetical protein
MVFLPPLPPAHGSLLLIRKRLILGEVRIWLDTGGRTVHFSLA